MLAQLNQSNFRYPSHPDTTIELNPVCLRDIVVLYLCTPGQQKHTTQVISDCSKVAADSREKFYFLQHHLYTLRILLAQGKLVLQQVT